MSATFPASSTPASTIPGIESFAFPESNSLPLSTTASASVDNAIANHWMPLPPGPGTFASGSSRRLQTFPSPADGGAFYYRPNVTPTPFQPALNVDFSPPVTSPTTGYRDGPRERVGHRPRPQDALRTHSGNENRRTLHHGHGRRNSNRRSSRPQNPFAPLGTREDVEDPNYESPIGLMFGRAWNRYRTAEEVRQADAATQNHTHGHPSAFVPPEQPSQVPGDVAMFNANNTDGLNSAVDHGLYGWQGPQNWSFTTNVPPQPETQRHLHEGHATNAASFVSRPHPAPPNATFPGSVHPGSMANMARYEAVTRANALLSGRIQQTHARFEQVLRAPAPVELDSTQETRRRTLDDQERPPPRKSEDLQLDMSCKICFEQIADVILIPCRHLFMCRWCADLSIPSKSQHMSHVPRDRHATCDLCRKGIKYRYQVFLPETK